ncbi:MAG: acyl-CoA desaturase [Gammaproteobacteria bacterium]|jgi:stearoyl-CoA desaturase (delta-9 desaturase)
METISEFTSGGLNAKAMRIANFTVYLISLFSIAAAIYWWKDTQTIHFVLFAIMFCLTGFGMTIGYHRYFTHRSFKCKLWFAKLLLILGSMSLSGSLLQWFRTHRAHHHFTDVEGDPHSPVVGPFKNPVLKFLHAHFVWLLIDSKPNRKLDDADQVLLAMVNRSRIAWPGMMHLFVVVMGMLIPGVIAGLWTHTLSGALLGVLWGGLLRALAFRHMLFGLNSFCHRFGERTYVTKDNSHDNWFFGIFTLGEGWHNSHHKFPYSARHGLKWWQFDLSYYVIYLLEKCGIIWDAKLPQNKS